MNRLLALEINFSVGEPIYLFVSLDCRSVFRDKQVTGMSLGLSLVFFRQFRHEPIVNFNTRRPPAAIIIIIGNFQKQVITNTNNKNRRQKMGGGAGSDCE